MNWVQRFEQRLLAFQTAYPWMKAQHIAILALWYTEQERIRTEMAVLQAHSSSNFWSAALGGLAPRQSGALQGVAQNLVAECTVAEGYGDVLT